MSSTKVFGRCVVDVVVVAAAAVVVVVVCPFSILAPKTIFTLKKEKNKAPNKKTEFVTTTNPDKYIKDIIF